MRYYDPKELLKVSEVAEALRVDDTTVRRWIKSGTVKAIVLPHSGERQAYRVTGETMNMLVNNPPPEAAATN